MKLVRMSEYSWYLPIISNNGDYFVSFLLFFTDVYGKLKQFSIRFLNNMFEKVLLLYFRKHLFTSISQTTFKLLQEIVHRDDIEINL